MFKLNSKMIYCTLLVSLVSCPMISIADDSSSTTTNSLDQNIKSGVSNVEKAATKAKDYTTDAAITAAVKAKIAAEPDIPITLSVTTKKGVVFLSGNVDTGIQANKAAEVAASIPGVKDVDGSGLTVKNSDNFLGDALVTAKVEGYLMQLAADNKISSSNNLHVETTNGVVHIIGTVGKSGDESVIKKSVAKLSGVKEVKTNLKLK